MTREEQIKDCEMGLAVAKERLIRAVLEVERANVALREANADYATYAEKLGRLAYESGPHKGDPHG